MQTNIHTLKYFKKRFKCRKHIQTNKKIYSNLINSMKIPSHSHKHTHTHINIKKHTYTNSYTHTHTHTHTQTQKQGSNVENTIQTNKEICSNLVQICTHTHKETHQFTY